MQPSIPDAKTFATHFEPHDNTDWEYLTHHYRRFATTLEEFCSSWELSRGKRVLDIGAHWLHQAILWKQAGFEVIAVDMPITFEMTSVQSLARANDIELIPCHDLEAGIELDVLPDSSVDVILLRKSSNT
ncbi:hypothetical protein [Dokdonella sp.]|uniref:hypothetical protein n=1 Tax=Dokdonella sp. TaxID=2291710 RepID=UPI003528F636